MTFHDQFFAGKTRAAVTRTPASSRPATPASTTIPAPGAGHGRRTTVAYIALLVFSFLYYARPEDFIPGLGLIPVGKISGGIALIALLLSWGRIRKKMPLEIKLILVLFCWMCLTVPFAYWRGGAFQVVRDEFSKAAMVALLISMIVSSIGELRKLLWVQVTSIAVLTIASLVVHPGSTQRLYGLGGGFSNPNDLAINLAINFPLCLAFLIGARGVLKKLIWAVAVLAMIYAVIATYSRSGMIAMVICFVICVWEFGLKGKRPQVVIAAIVMLAVAAGVAVTTPRYVLRLKTLVGGNIQGTMDHGSLDARRELLAQSIQVTLEHPIFGVGPGNFEAYTASWRVTHNTYTQLSSEAGIPALIMFLVILLLAFRNLKRVAKAPGYKTNREMQLFTNALRAAVAAYIVGAMFASTAYTLYPYFVVAYTTVLYGIGFSPQTVQDKQLSQESATARNREKSYGKQRPSVLAGTR